MTSSKISAMPCAAVTSRRARRKSRCAGIRPTRFGIGSTSTAARVLASRSMRATAISAWLNGSTTTSSSTAGGTPRE